MPTLLINTRYQIAFILRLFPFGTEQGILFILELDNSTFFLSSGSIPGSVLVNLKNCLHQSMLMNINFQPFIKIVSSKISVS